MCPTLFMSYEATGSGDLITGLPQSFLDEFEAEIRGRVPAEKVAAQLRQEKLARVMKQVGSTQIDTLGQKITSMDPRLYFRCFAERGHEENWIDDLLKDNPELCAPGYRPRRKGDFRHGKTFIAGKPV